MLHYINWIRSRILILDQKIVSFLLVGGFNTLVGFCLFPTVYWYFAPYRKHYLIMLISCHIITVVNAYLTNKYFVFRTQGDYAQEVMKFGLYHGAYFLAMITFLPMLVERSKISPVIIQFLVTVFVVCLNFFWYEKVVFSDGSKKTL